MNDTQQAPVILGPDGKPTTSAKKKGPTPCQKCGAGEDKRVLSGGFGEPHDVCGRCGFEYQERTL